MKNISALPPSILIASIIISLVGSGRFAQAGPTETTPLATNETAALHKSAENKLRNRDVPGALADYTRAIELNPQDTAAYRGRAFLKTATSKPDDALADYNRAVEINPQDLENYSRRGLFKKGRGDIAGAIADFSKMIELQPRALIGYELRGNTYHSQGQLADALADYDRALEVNPDSLSFHIARGTTHYDLGNWAAAVADLRHTIDRNREDYGRLRLRIWLARAHLGEREAATTELKTYMRTRSVGKPGDWNATVAAFLTGDLSEKDFFRAAASGSPAQAIEQTSRAFFYTASLHQINGEEAAALADFKKCVEIKPWLFEEARSAALSLPKS